MKIDKRKCIMLFCISIILSYSFFSIRSGLMKVREKYEVLGVEESTETVFEEENTDVVAKLKILNTPINDSIFQGKDNDFYLSHDENGDYKEGGLLMMDYRNKLDDTNLIIYGHNSLNVDTSFKRLENYLNKEYFETNNMIELIDDDKVNTYEIFSVMIAPVTTTRHTKTNFDSIEFNKYLEWLKNNSIYYKSVEGNKNILTLQTCTYDPEGYLIISAILK